MPKHDAEVRVAITAQDQASAALHHLGEEISGLASHVEGLGSLLTMVAGGGPLAIFAGIAAGAAELATSTAEYEAAVYRAAQITHISTENLSGLRVAADQAHESFDTLSSTLAKLGKSLAEAFDKPTSEPAKLLTALFTKSETESLKLLPVDERIHKVVAAIFDLKEPSDQQLALSILLGKQWQSNVETLKRLAEEGYAPLVAKAKELNESVSPEHAQAAHEYEVAWSNLKNTFAGVAHVVGDELIPVVTALMRVYTANNDGFWQEQQKRLDLLRSMLGRYENNPDLKASDEQIASIRAEIVSIEDWMQAQKKAAAAYNADAEAAKKAAPAHKSLADALGHEAKARKEVEDTYSDPTAKLLEPILRQFAAMGKTTHQLELYELAMKGVDAADVEFAGRLLAQVDAFNASAKAMADWKSQADEHMASLEAFGEQMRAEVITPAEELQQALSNANQTLNARRVPPEVYRKFVDKHEDAFNKTKEDEAAKAIDDMGIGISKLDVFANRFGHDMGRAFDSLITSGASFGRVMDGLLAKLGEVILQVTVFGPLADKFSGNRLLGSIFSEMAGPGIAGGRASGGPVSFGQSYMVGENGPEIFTPGISGGITPNSALQGGGVIQHFHIDARGADAGVERRVQRGIQEGMKQAAVNGYILTREMARRGA